MTATIQPFRNKSFVLFLLAAFVLLCMPTVSIGDNFLTSQSSSLAHDVPNSVKVTKRASASLNSKALITALLLLVFHFSLHAYSTYIVPASKTVSLPVHLPGLRKLLLMPLKFTSTYVRM
jgi:choline-glycine betaine transporter